MDMPPAAAPTRLPRALLALNSTVFPTVSAAKRACRRGRVFLNGVQARSDTDAWPSDRIALQEPVEPGPAVPGGQVRFELTVMYEDDSLAVVVKPRGLALFPSDAAVGEWTLQDALPLVLSPAPPDAAAGDAWPEPAEGPVGEAGLEDGDAADASEIVTDAEGDSAAGWQPHPVHRLDRATGGLLLVAKTRRAASALGRLFATRRVRKEYLALVTGTLEGNGTIDVPVDGLHALTAWEALWHRPANAPYGTVTAVCLRPVTGRRHQLRQHLRHLGHPIVGDRRYGTAHLQEMCLWAT
eukprot:EG_transcript_18490